MSVRCTLGEGDVARLDGGGHVETDVAEEHGEVTRGAAEQSVSVLIDGVMCLWTLPFFWSSSLQHLAFFPVYLLAPTLIASSFE